MSRALLLAFVMLLAGCMSAPRNVRPVDLTSGGWSTRQGQVTWKRNKNAAEISGDLLVARDENGTAFVRFAKDPFTIVSANCGAARWDITFGGKYYFHGGANRPTRFIWLYLPDILMSTNSAPKPWVLKREDAELTLLENTKSGERLEIFLP